MSKLLDTTNATTIADAVVELLDDLGYDAGESIPGLIGAIYRVAGSTRSFEQIMDEAANLLADGVE